jgi:hypothetical protein
LQQSAGSDLCGARVAIAANTFDTAEAIGDTIRNANGQFTWRRENELLDSNNSVDAGVWVGGQLSDAETARLACFSNELAQLGASVIALLDFPRRDRCESARQAGAAAVLGLPWRNDDLIDELRQAIDDAKSRNPLSATRAA